MTEATEQAQANSSDAPAEELDNHTTDTVVFRYSTLNDGVSPSDASGPAYPQYEDDSSSDEAEPASVVEDNSEPQEFFGWLMRSYSLMRKGEKEQAWQAALKALELGTDEPDLLVPLCQQFEPRQRRQLAHSAMERTAPTHDAFQWLWVEVALSYWYEGNYSEACAEYATILMQKNLDPGLMGVMLNGWAMSLEALGRYSEAEQKYLEAGNQEAAVRARARSGDVAGALKFMQEDGYGPSDIRVRAALEATWMCLLGQSVSDIASRIADLKSIEDDWIYKDFMLGVMQIVAQQHDEGAANLERFLTICHRNPNEWGVTLRWETGIAQEVLRILIDNAQRG